jgi:hypothetical protein
VLLFNKRTGDVKLEMAVERRKIKMVNRSIRMQTYNNTFSFANGK